MTEAERKAWNAAIEAAIRHLHFMWNADGTPAERRVMEESMESLRYLKHREAE